MPRIFISYRREDSAGHAGRLYDRLVEKFGWENVFMDVDTIEPGTDFVEAVERYVGSCDVLLAVIGTRWQSGNRRRRRLHDASDFVRLELATALKRDIRLIPVLIQEAELPDLEQLPEDLAPLLRRQAFELRDSRWSQDCEHLMSALERIPSSTTGESPGSKRDPGSPAEQSPAAPEEPASSNSSPPIEQTVDNKHESAGGRLAEWEPKGEVAQEPWFRPTWSRVLFVVIGYGALGALLNVRDNRLSFLLVGASFTLLAVSGHLAILSARPRQPWWVHGGSLVAALLLGVTSGLLIARFSWSIADWADMTSTEANGAQLTSLAGGAAFGSLLGARLWLRRFGMRLARADRFVTIVAVVAAIVGSASGMTLLDRRLLPPPTMIAATAVMALFIYLGLIWLAVRSNQSPA